LVCGVPGETVRVIGGLSLASATPSAKPMRWRRCPSPKTSRRLPPSGILIAPWRAGICGAAWNRRLSCSCGAGRGPGLRRRGGARAGVRALAQGMAPRDRDRGNGPGCGFFAGHGPAPLGSGHGHALLDCQCYGGSGCAAHRHYYVLRSCGCVRWHDYVDLGHSRQSGRDTCE